MSKLSTDDVLKLAKLSRLRLSPEEVTQFADEISAILGYVEQLQELDLANLESTYQVTGLKNVTRQDVLKDYGTTPKELLKNAPAMEGKHVKVRRMIA